MSQSFQPALERAGATPGRRGIAALAWPLVAVLFAVELFFLAERFEISRLAGHPAWWAVPLRLLPSLFELAACCLAASIVLGRSRLLATAATLLDHDQDRRGLGVALCTHAAGLFAVYGLLAVLVEGRGPASLAGTTGAVTLLAVAPVWFLAGLSIATPTSRLLAFAAHARRPLLGGLAVGGLAFALARGFAAQDALWRPFSLATIEATATFLGAIGQIAIVDRSELAVGTPVFSVVVTRYVSGYETVGLFAILATALGLCVASELRLRRYLALVLAGTLVVWLVGAARIAVLVALGRFVSEEFAVSAFHTHLGWIPWVGAALVLVSIGLHHPAVAKDLRDEPQAPARATSAHLTPLLASFALWIAASSLTRDPRGLLALGVPLVAWLALRSRRDRAPLFASGPRILFVAVPLATVAWVALADAQGLLARPLGMPHPPRGFDTLAYLVLTLTGYAVVTPLVQELAFRGWLQRRLQDRDFELVPQGSLTPLAVLVPAVLFGLLSGNLLGGFFLSVLASGATSLRGRLSDAVFLHVGVRAALVIVAIGSGHHELWLAHG